MKLGGVRGLYRIVIGFVRTRSDLIFLWTCIYWRWIASAIRLAIPLHHSVARFGVRWLIGTPSWHRCCGRGGAEVP